MLRKYNQDKALLILFDLKFVRSFNLPEQQADDAVRIADLGS